MEQRYETKDQRIEWLEAENAKLRAERDHEKAWAEKHDAERHDAEARYELTVEKLQATLLQNSAMRRALTDVMRFSSDDRSRGVASGILAAHGGPDPIECTPLKPKCDHAGRMETADGQTGLRCGKCGERFHDITEKRKCAKTSGSAVCIHEAGHTGWCEDGMSVRWHD